MDHSLVTTGLAKLSEAMSHACRATQDGPVIMKRSDKTGTTGGGNSKSLW